MKYICSQHQKEIIKICMNENCGVWTRLLCQNCDQALLHQYDQNFNYVDHIQSLSLIQDQLLEQKRTIQEQLNHNQIYFECAYYIYYKFVQNQYSFTLDKLINIRKVLQKIYQAKEQFQSMNISSFINATTTHQNLTLKKFVMQISNPAQVCEEIKCQFIREIAQMKIEEQNQNLFQINVGIICDQDELLFQKIGFSLHTNKFFYYYKWIKTVSQFLYYFILYIILILFCCHRQMLKSLKLIENNKDYLNFKLNDTQLAIHNISSCQPKDNHQDKQEYNGFLYLRAILEDNKEQITKLYLIECAIQSDYLCFYLLLEKIQILINLNYYQLCIKFIKYIINEKLYFQDLYYYLGLSYSKIHMFQDAIKYLKKQIYLNQYHINCYLSLAQVYQNMNMYDLSKKTIKEVIQIDPKCNQSYFALSYHVVDLEMYKGNIDKANEAITEEQNQCQKHELSDFYYAKKLINLDDYDGAFIQIEKILNINPQNINAIMLIVQIHVKTNNDTIEQIKQLKSIDSIQSFQVLVDYGFTLLQTHPEKARNLFYSMKRVFRDKHAQIEEYINQTKNLQKQYDNKLI
ncbi:hypothetical protein pb186bvf_002109 [Paramecium bursaria]